MNTADNKGFTLVEVMISVALVVVIIGISTSSWLALARASAAATQCAEMHSELRHAYDIMIKDLTSASEVISFGTGGNPFVRVMAERPTGSESVYYIFSANRLYQVDTSTKILVEDVSDMQLKFYESDGVTETSIAADIYSIDIRVTATKNVAGEPFEDVFQSRVMLRNKGL